MIKEMIGLTKALDYTILKHLGLEPNGNTLYKVCYEGFISKCQPCYDKIVEYHKLQSGSDKLDAVFRLSTPLFIKIHSDNCITYSLSLNDRDLCFLGELDLNALFKTEIREYKLESLFVF
jgi:hypothetical protein